ncbi:hypothetical protein A9P82_01150 [Arachidicoccus ginsenosidimutans]|uniref:DUF3127 domain-containing protein n=1 Tax=Arachidicoccus sp. BS20 TaxID=1850526 RepID=UPI0007F0E67D|nr:DUF3127 domain-containing protein [Arachidicoccus sp. BS20]ANI88047.1 hypothetical protein A9P82_01150 [Arachidicoccus sp. BS20]
MSYEVTGKLVAKYDTVQRTETFKTREFVIEKSDDIGGRIINNYVKFQCVQDKTALPDKFNIGDDIKVSFNLKGTKWSKDGRENYITNLDAWRLEAAGSLAQTAINNAPDNFVPDAAPDDVVDDLPF